MKRINQMEHKIERAREEYILKELTKTYRILKAANWAVVGLIVLYAAIAVFRVSNGSGLPKLSYKNVIQLFWVAAWCLYVRYLERRYRVAAEETGRAMNDPSFREYSDLSTAVRNNTIKAATTKAVMGVVLGILGIFLVAGGMLIFFMCWRNQDWTFLHLVLCAAPFAAGVLLVVWGVSECKDAPEGKRLFGNNPQR